VGRKNKTGVTDGGKWTHEAAQNALAWKLEESRGVASGTSMKQESKWSQKPVEFLGADIEKSE
jgi:hypothetical protein